MSLLLQPAWAICNGDIPVRNSALQRESGYALSVSPNGPGRLVLLILTLSIYIHISLGTKLKSEPAAPHAQAKRGLTGLSVMESWRKLVTPRTLHMDGRRVKSDSECFSTTVRHGESGSSITPLS